MRKAIIIGGDRVSLRTAAELLKKTDIVPVILEKTGDLGMPTLPLGYWNWVGRLFGNFIVFVSTGLRRLGFVTAPPGADSSDSWNRLAQEIQARGGEILLHRQLYSIYTIRDKVCSIHVINNETGELALFEGDYFVSTTQCLELYEQCPEIAGNCSNLFIVGHKKVYEHLIHISI